MELAKPGDPLVSREGDLLEANGRVEPKYSIEVPIAKNITPKVTRSLRELGTDAQTQTVVNAVLVYKLLGLTANEIAHLLNTTIEKVEDIFDLQAFQDTFDIIWRELLSTSSTSIRARIASYAGRALDNLFTLADSKPVEIKAVDEFGNEYTQKHYDVPPIVIMKSNDSILDRAGLGADVLYDNKADDNPQQLEIEITSGNSNKTDVKINFGRR